MLHKEAAGAEIAIGPLFIMLLQDTLPTEARPKCSDVEYYLRHDTITTLASDHVHASSPTSLTAWRLNRLNSGYGDRTMGI
jgi:hypothetical protein